MKNSSASAATAEPARLSSVVVELSAAIAAVTDESPKILVVQPPDTAARAGLPCGPFDPTGHRTLEEGLRTSVNQQTGLALGYVEQLYTFGNQFRDPEERAGGPRPVSVGYLALVRQTEVKSSAKADWVDWYRHFPWEDARKGTPTILDSVILPRLTTWREDAKGPERLRRRDRLALAFGLEGAAWDNERVLDRYELLYEAGLVFEASFDSGQKVEPNVVAAQMVTGAALTKDHRRILATALGRLRAKIKYRPVIFELMPPTFTLFQLQRAVEALAGGPLHKQNFRRLVANEGLVEPTGHVSAQTGGRPAEIFRFRREVVHERPAPGVRVPVRVRK